MEIITLLNQSIQSLGLPRNGYSRPHGTLLITKTIKSLCQKNNIQCEAEARIGLWRDGKTSQQGIIDFLLKHNNIQYAIEIDSANKKWSLEKLQYMADQGHQAIWIRWRHPITVDIPLNIHLLNFTD